MKNMPLFRHLKDIATVYRLSYSGNKSSYVASGATYKGYLKPLNIEDSQYLQAFGKNYRFTTEYTANIQESDRLDIEGVDYSVKGVAKKEGIKVKYTEVLLVKI